MLCIQYKKFSAMGQQTSVHIVGTRTNKTGKEVRKSRNERLKTCTPVRDSAIDQYLGSTNNMIPQSGTIYSPENYSDLTQTEQLLILSDPFCKSVS